MTLRAFWRRAAVFVAACMAASAADLTGYWLVRVPTGDGNYRENIFEFAQAGARLTGKVHLDWGDLPLVDGSVQGNAFHFAVKFGDPPVVESYTGTLAKNEIRMSWRVAGRPAQTGTGTLTTAKALEPPPKLPLPELHALPDNGLARTPPMGWNSWNHFHGRIDEAAVRGVADAMAANGMRDAGYVYINIDDTWEGQRDSSGDIQPNRKFPDMKALADYVHSKHMMLGIYSSPGPKTCGGYEGSYGHEMQDARTFANWGIDYLKYDWCSAGKIYSDAEMHAVFQRMGEALQSSGRPMVYSLSQGGRAEVWKWGAEAGANLWRTTDDIRDSWASVSKIGFHQDGMEQWSKQGHWNDPDMLEIGNGNLTDAESRTHMSLWAILAAPLLAGNDVRSMTPETLRILTNKEVIAIDQDSLGKQGNRIHTMGDIEMWSRQLSDGAQALAWFNRGPGAAALTINWKDLGYKGKLLARDLWRHAEVDLSKPEFTMEIASHDVLLLRVYTVTR